MQLSNHLDSENKIRLLIHIYDQLTRTFEDVSYFKYLRIHNIMHNNYK